MARFITIDQSNYYEITSQYQIQYGDDSLLGKLLEFLHIPPAFYEEVFHIITMIHGNPLFLYGFLILTQIGVSIGFYKICYKLMARKSWIAAIPVAQFYMLFRISDMILMRFLFRYVYVICGAVIMILLLHLIKAPGYLFTAVNLSVFLFLILYYIILLYKLSKNCKEGLFITIGLLLAPGIVFPVLGYTMD